MQSGQYPHNTSMTSAEVLSQSETPSQQIAAAFSAFTLQTEGKVFYYQADGACTTFDKQTNTLTAFGQEDRRRDLHAECRMIQTFLDARCRTLLIGISNYLVLSEPGSKSFVYRCASFFRTASMLTKALFSESENFQKAPLEHEALSQEQYRIYQHKIAERIKFADPILPSELTKLLRGFRKTNDPILTQSFSELEEAEKILYALAHRDTQSATYQMLLHQKVQKIEIIEPKLRTMSDIFQEAQKPLGLQISAYISQGGGTAGLAKLVARDLTHRLPNLKVHLDIVGENHSTNIFGMNNKPATPFKRPNCILNLAFGLMVGQRAPHIPDITFDTLPREMDAANALLQNRLLTLDLASAFGAVPFDHSLSSRRTNADTWDTTKLFAEREAWLRTALTEEAYALLTEHYHGSLSTAGWGFGYYQDAKNFLHGVEKVIAWHKEHVTAQQPLVYFVIDGKHTRFIHGSVSREDIAAKWARVIDTATRTIYNPSDSSAVTFCFLDSLKHDDILSLFSELHGLPMKESYQTGKGSFWAQAPALVTGNASTFEAISAGLPILHDSYDAGLHGFDLAAKHLAHMQRPNSASILAHTHESLPPIRELTIEGRQLSDACSYRDLGSECMLQIARRLSETDASLLP